MVLIALGLLVVVWLAIKASQGGTTFFQVTLNGITDAALYFIVAAGFTLIFGLMRVVNMAHGSLYLFGGYIAYVAQTHWFRAGPRSSSSRATSTHQHLRGSSCRWCSRPW